MEVWKFLMIDPITKINELKILAKHISCKYKINLMVGNVTQIKSRILINVDVSAKFCQKIMCAI